MHQTLTYFAINVDITIEPGKIAHFPHKYPGVCIANWYVYFWTHRYMAESVLGLTLIG